MWRKRLSKWLYLKQQDLRRSATNQRPTGSVRYSVSFAQAIKQVTVIDVLLRCIFDNYGEESINGRTQCSCVSACQLNLSYNAQTPFFFLFRKAGYRVISSGTGSAVRLPGSSIDKPNIYPFGTPYNQIYEELSTKDSRL